MAEIRKITCGRIPRVMPDGKKVAPDYYELTVNGSTAELAVFLENEVERFEVKNESLLEAVLDRALEFIEESPDEQPYPETVPFAKDILFDDGTVRYADKDDLINLLEILLPFSSSEALNPQGLVQAPANSFSGIPALMGIPGSGSIIEKMPEREYEMPMLQGIVPAPQKQQHKFEPPIIHEKWECPKCSETNEGKFCSGCGSPKPKKG